MARFSADFSPYGSTPASSLRGSPPPSRKRAEVPGILPMEGVEDEVARAAARLHKIEKEQEAIRIRREEFAEHRDRVRWEKRQAQATTSSRDPDEENIPTQLDPPRDGTRPDIAREQYVRSEQFARSAEAKREATRGVREKEVEAQLDDASNAADVQYRVTPGKVAARQTERELLVHAQRLAEALDNYRRKYQTNAEEVTAAQDSGPASFTDSLPRSSTNPPRKPFGHRNMPERPPAGQAFGYDSSQWGKAAAQHQARAKADNAARKERKFRFDTSSFAQATETIRKKAQAEREAEDFDEGDRTHDYEAFKARKEAIEVAESVRKAAERAAAHKYNLERQNAEQEARREKLRYEEIKKRLHERTEARRKAEEQAKINAEVAAAKMEAERQQRERDFVERMARERAEQQAQEERQRKAREEAMRRFREEMERRRRTAEEHERVRYEEQAHKQQRQNWEQRQREYEAAEELRHEREQFDRQRREREERAKNTMPPPPRPSPRARPGPSGARPQPQAQQEDRERWRPPPTPGRFKVRNPVGAINNENPRPNDVQTNFVSYETRWTGLANLPAEPAWTFNTIPWPVTYPISSPSELKLLALRRFLLANVHSEGKTKKQRIREALLRWHPDKFLPRFLQNVREADRDAVAQGVNAISRLLHEIE